jgi:hypothetical protein
MSDLTRPLPDPKTVRAEATIPISQRDRLGRAIVDLFVGERPRMDALDRAARL